MIIAERNVSIAIVDDHNLFRKGLAGLIDQCRGKYRYELLFEAAGGDELKARVKQGPAPEIIIVNVDLEVTDGYRSVEWLGEEYPAIRILAIITHESDEAIRKMLRYGIKGYLTKHVEVKDLQAVLDNIAAGHFALNMVSKRELEFLQLLCKEMTYREIAAKMSLSVSTIDSCRDDLFRRFGVHTRTGLTMFAVKNGLVNLA